MDKKYSLGVDYGTNSVRALIVDLATGEEVGTCVYAYPSGKDGIILDDNDANFARENPMDFVLGMEVSVKGAIEQASSVAGFSSGDIIGIGIDTTGSTPIPVGEDGMPLSFQDRFKGNPNAMAWLWKDHTSHEEAELINRKAHEYKIDYTKYSGGIYSSEWFFSKIFHLANVDPEVFNAAASFVEHCDWMPALLSGNTDPKQIKRSRCAAGHKAMWHEEWGGLPSQDFLSSLSPKLDGLYAKLYTDTFTSDTNVGGLCAEWAGKLGLREGIAVSVGAFDAHMGAVGAGIKPGALVKIMGTSTCDMMVAPELHTQIKGICGQVDGSVVPGMVGLEAGQSAVGDIFAWYRDQIRWPIENLLPLSSISSVLTGDKLAELMEEAKGLFFSVLTDRASKFKTGQSGLLALDWLNGNRTVLVDPNLSGAIIGLTLGTKPEEIFMSLIEATAYGARVIIERFEEYGVKVDQIITCGGLAEKNPFLMQIYADVTGRPMKVSRSSQTCALGAALFGAVAGGAFANVEQAQSAISGLKDVVYTPDPENSKTYNKLFRYYKTLHDSLGTREYSDHLYEVMKGLLEIKRSARA
ncbi:MAG: ribulokinase [Armatimonadota bacterium]|nr:ribulokinase [bacterium]